MENKVLKIPMISLRGLIIMPKMTIHFDVGRKRSVAAIEVALKTNTPVFLVGQRQMADETPTHDSLYSIGTIAYIRQVLKLPGDNVRVLVEGVDRGKLLELSAGKQYFQATVEKIEEIDKSDDIYAKAAIREAQTVFEEYSAYAPKISPEVIIAMISAENPGEIADYIASNININYILKQKILENLDGVERLKALISILIEETQIMQAENKIRSQVKDQMDKHQREYYLREQIKVIQNELGEGENSADEILEFRRKLFELELAKEIEDSLLKEINRLSKIGQNSSEASVVRNYIETCLELPWNKRSKEKLEIERVRNVLNKDHYGMEKLKERILEHLAVAKLTKGKNVQIICLVGPPGVGKTSVAASIARATNRKYARIALGGIRDEAEIRGHRKTYIGAMPGRIIAALRQAGTKNPLILLDEIDKLTSDMRGDPAAALLEVLDSEQNFSFRDHFVELPFDLSEIMFITTANTKDTIPRPLLDRMELIEMTSYTDEEKKHIAIDHLIPKQIKKHGLKKSAVKISTIALAEIIDGYTRESGVRTLERKIAAVCRKAAINLVGEGGKGVAVTPDNLKEILGSPRYKREENLHENEVGICNGLAYTTVGGETLTIETSVVPGTGKIQLTGSLGDVMKESCNAAISYIRSRAESLGIDAEFYKNTDVHIHFPEGAVPKDGPSAGVAITTALVSAYTNRPVRGDIAMTGEVTLRGRVLAIGGLKEKTMAALRDGISLVIIPYDNGSDLDEIDKDVRSALKFKLVKHADEVLDIALLDIPVVKEDGKLEIPFIKESKAQANLYN